MNTTAESTLARARAILKKRAPYMAKTYYGFIPIEQPGIKTMGVSEGMVLVYDPEWVASIPDDEIAAAVFHECMHIVRNHLPRILALPDHALANIAGDLVINPELRDAGWKLPHGVYPEDYGFPRELTLEGYYKLLTQRREQQQQQQGKSGGQGKPSQSKNKSQGQGKQEEDDQGSDGQQGNGGSKNKPGSGKSSGPPAPKKGGERDKGQGQGTGQEPGEGGGTSNPNLPDGRTPGLSHGRCGGCAGSPVSPVEQKLNEEHGRSELEQKNIVKATIDDIQKYAEQHGRGSVPGGLLQVLDAKTEKSEVKWQSKLAHWLKKCFGQVESGGMDFSLARPAKRSFTRGFPRPGLVQYQPEVCFILDTSASMGEKQLLAALAEAVAIMKSLGLEFVWFIQADAGIAQKAHRVSLRDLMGQVKIHGRGGTNFDPALKAATAIRPKLNMIVYFTDGDGHVSFKPPGVEVVWCIVRNHWNKKPPCDWGHAVIIADEGKPKRAPKTAA